MAVYYSFTTKGFYDSNRKQIKLPDDAVEITEKQHVYLLDCQSHGKLIIFDEATQQPILIDPPAPSERQVKDARIVEIDKELDVLDLKSVRSLRILKAGSSTEEDEAYLLALEAQAETLRAERAALAVKG